VRSECLRRVLDQLTDAQQEALDTTGLALDAEGDCLDGKPGQMGYYRLEYDENDSKDLSPLVEQRTAAGLGNTGGA